MPTGKFYIPLTEPEFAGIPADVQTAFTQNQQTIAGLASVDELLTLPKTVIENSQFFLDATRADFTIELALVVDGEVRIFNINNVSPDDKANEVIQKLTKFLEEVFEECSDSDDKKAALLTSVLACGQKDLLCVKNSVGKVINQAVDPIYEMLPEWKGWRVQITVNNGKFESLTTDVEASLPKVRVFEYVSKRGEKIPEAKGQLEADFGSAIATGKMTVGASPKEPSTHLLTQIMVMITSEFVDAFKEVRSKPYCKEAVATAKPKKADKILQPLRALVRGVRSMSVGPSASASVSASREDARNAVSEPSLAEPPWQDISESDLSNTYLPSASSSSGTSSRDTPAAASLRSILDKQKPVQKPPKK